MNVLPVLAAALIPLLQDIAARRRTIPGDRRLGRGTRGRLT